MNIKADLNGALDFLSEQRGREDEECDKESESIACHGSFGVNIGAEGMAGWVTRAIYLCAMGCHSSSLGFLEGL